MAMTSVKVLRLCDEIQANLNQSERITVILRLVEFIYASEELTEQMLEFLDTVTTSFNISSDLQNAIKQFVTDDVNTDNEFFLTKDSKHVLDHSHSPEGKLIFFRDPEENLFFLKYSGSEELVLNGSHLYPQAIYPFPVGSSIRGPRVNTIFYSDILHAFLNTEHIPHFEFEVKSVFHEFSKGKTAVDTLSFRTESSNLIGIMGGSGSGKSTLLNILNGNTKPKRGDVLLNGQSIFQSKKLIRKSMGYISQDDILIEELTVFQNLFFNAQLVFKGKSKEELKAMVFETLSNVGLLEVKDLRVGSVLDKTISGGQRKRLNIALELIREPEVLFVDEPTSGLSSRDSENIMDLLKELSLRGKLIFVVIHQPSSDIFNLFDKLLLLDQGGKPIYYGDPIDSILYFKKLVNQVNIDETKCPLCGNVNPEQLFSIIEAKVIDEFGRETSQRKVSPAEWNSLYHVLNQDSANNNTNTKHSIPFQKDYELPSMTRQFLIFIKRDILGKITNKQYLIINLLEAPLLAFLLSWFVKYEGSDGYSFLKNQNFPQFLFIAVVVSLFMGLTVSAEEIIKDQKILKRESYLGLNKGAYLLSKIKLMFLISAVQTALYVGIGNYILEVKDMFWPFFAILFSTACFANVLGLNISATFNSAKVIYIVIPI
ncbi:MAG: ATP-binding cassette domain-containing protein, partial [Bacteroidota bacterium]